MTNERIAIEMLGRCSLLPGSYDKRFIKAINAYPENHRLSAKQRALMWKLVVKYRRQSTVGANAVAWAHDWLGRPDMQIAFEQKLDDDPTDATTRAVYADWLDENGDSPLADAQRWMAVKKVFPELHGVGIAFGPNGSHRINFEWTMTMKAWEQFKELCVFRYWNSSREGAERNIADCIVGLGTMSASEGRSS